MGSSTIADQMPLAEKSIRAALDAGSPGDQMEALMLGYRQASDAEAFVLALIGNVVMSKRVASLQRGLARRYDVTPSKSEVGMTVEDLIEHLAAMPSATIVHYIGDDDEPYGVEKQNIVYHPEGGYHGAAGFVKTGSVVIG